MSQPIPPAHPPIGKAMLIASPRAATHPARILDNLGYQCSVMEDPYAAMLELSRRPLGYRSLVLWLGSLYREELSIIRTVKQRFPQIDVWLGDTDHHAAATAEAMRHGADGLLDEEGFHRTGTSHAPEVSHSVDRPTAATPPSPTHAAPSDSAPAPDASPEPAALVTSPADDEPEPLLTAEELRALLRGPE